MHLPSLCLLCLVCLWRFCCGEEPQVIVHLDSRNTRHDKDGPVRMISYCLGCPSPADEGSLLYGLLSWHAVATRQVFSISGALIYSVPNLADSDKIINTSQLADRVALVDRGKVPLHEKVRRMQQAGASAVIIADDGQCDESFLFCGPRAGSSREGGFAAYDDEYIWAAITIPVYLISASSAAHLRQLMPLTEVNVRGRGLQKITNRLSGVSATRGFEF